MTKLSIEKYNGLSEITIDEMTNIFGGHEGCANKAGQIVGSAAADLVFAFMTAVSWVRDYTINRIVDKKVHH